MAITRAVVDLPKASWLSGMDSNHDKELQRLLCYHYTTGQAGHKLATAPARRKGKRASLLPYAGNGINKAGRQSGSKEEQQVP
jgi:hypothetical protein